MCYRDTRLACRGAPTHVYHITCTRQTSTSWELLRPCHRLPFCSPFPSRLLFVAGGPTWPEGKACTHHSSSMGTCSPASVVSENRHQQASSRTPQCMHARHAHIECIQQNNIACRACGTKQEVHRAQADFAMRSARVVQAARLPRWICAHK
jgi:hypothetical protein